MNISKVLLNQLYSAITIPKKEAFIFAKKKSNRFILITTFNNTFSLFVQAIRNH